LIAREQSALGRRAGRSPRSPRPCGWRRRRVGLRGRAHWGGAPRGGGSAAGPPRRVDVRGGWERGTSVYERRVCVLLWHGSPFVSGPTLCLNPEAFVDEEASWRVGLVGIFTCSTEAQAGQWRNVGIANCRRFRVRPVSWMIDTHNKYALARPILEERSETTFSPRFQLAVVACCSPRVYRVRSPLLCGYGGCMCLSKTAYSELALMHIYYFATHIQIRCFVELLVDAARIII
jgi:hypothetical protein